MSTSEMHRNRTAAERAVKDAVESCKRRWGAGWAHITAEHREAEVRSVVLSRIASMDDDTPESPTVFRRMKAIAYAATIWSGE